MLNVDLALRKFKGSTAKNDETEFSYCLHCIFVSPVFRVSAKNSAGAVSPPSESTGPVECRDMSEAPTVEIDAKFSETVTVKAGDNVKIETKIAGKERVMFNTICIIYPKRPKYRFQQICR